MRMINRILLSLVAVFLSLSLSAQDIFPVTQLTTDPAQEGFPCWSSDGSYIIFQRSQRYDTSGKNGIWKYYLADGRKEQVYSGLAEHPRLSPDDRFIVFDADTGNNIKLLDLETGRAELFLPDSIRIFRGSLPIWSPSGSRIAFKDNMYAICIYDVVTKGVSRIFTDAGKMVLPGCWTADGENVLVNAIDRETRQSWVWKVSRDGTTSELISGHHEKLYRYLAVSPDGTMLAYAAMENRQLGLWVMPMAGGTSIPVAITHPGHNESPQWSPDAKRIAFTSTRAGSFDIWLMEIDVEQLKKELHIR